MATMKDLRDLPSLHLPAYSSQDGVHLLLINQTSYAISICLILIFFCFVRIVFSGRPILPLNAPPLWKPDDWPVLGALRFFTQRTDMVLDAVAENQSSGSHSGNFSFYIGKKHVVGIGRAQEARIAFYESRDMDLVQA